MNTSPLSIDLSFLCLISYFYTRNTQSLSTMKSFWALPAFLRLVIARQHHFNVLDDLHAYPQVSFSDEVSHYHDQNLQLLQYEVVFSDKPISEESVAQRLSASTLASAATGIEQHLTSDTSINTIHSDYSNLDDSLHLNDDIVGYESMMLHGQRFLCSIPRVHDDDDTLKSNQTVEEDNRELARASDRGWALLKDMEGKCIYYISGWWSYSFCYNMGVRQFHQLPPGRNVPTWPPIEDRTVQAYELGKFEKDGGNAETSEGKEIREQGLARLETKGEMRYLVQNLGGGTTCDLTGKPRRIEIQFHCEPTMPADRITLIKETSTCQYLMVVSTPLLCNDVAFQPPQEARPYPITCTPVMSAEDIPKFIAAKEAREEAEDHVKDTELDVLMRRLQAGQVLFDDSNNDIREAQPKRREVIGGIEVGGHKLVPKGKMIEKSALVGGGKETLVATIANSDGYIASEKELKSLRIPSGKEVEAVKREVEKVARGQGWRLDVVDTPRGRELRGIIETDDETDEREQPSSDATKTGSSERGEDSFVEERRTEGKESDGSEEVYKEER